MSNILFTEPAEYDLIEIEYYIFVHLGNPIAADRVVDGIMDTIEGLSGFPKEHSFVNDTLLARLGVRMTWFDNYNIFYFYDVHTDVIHILRILNNRADWKNILKR